MFEGKPPKTQGAKPVPQPSDADDALRSVAWGDLVAKLAAARQLRSDGEVAQSTGEASFGPQFVRRIAARSDGKPEINRDGLGDRKVAGGNGVSSPNKRNSGD